MISSLIAINPSDKLTFYLSFEKNSKTILTVTNISQNKIAFKIKTTQPSWYIVKPNQHVLDVNKSEEIVINLLSTECSRFLEISDLERSNLLTNHKFLIQSKIITDQTYNRLLELSNDQKLSEYQKIWETINKDAIINQKLKVSFEIAQNMNNQNEEGISAPTISENVENLKSKLAKYEGEILQISRSPLIYDNLENLRLKYNTVLELTTKLTAERDICLSQYQTLRKEYNLLKNYNEQESTEEINLLNNSQKKRQNVTTKQGYSFLTLVIVAATIYIFTRYIQSKTRIQEEGQ